MKVLCEMLISEFFWLSSGQVAIVGKIQPLIKSFIPADSKADLYEDNKKIQTIHIIGEDRFFGVNEIKRQGKRAVRTDSELSKDLKGLANLKLIFWD